MKDNKNPKKLKELFEAGVHLGHKKNRVHPKAKKHIYQFEKGVSIIDLTQTLEQLIKAQKFLQESRDNNLQILVVATKKIISELATEVSKKAGLPYITTKWMSGLLTNFETIMKNVKRLKELKEEKETGAWNKLVKHERTKLDKEINKLEKFYGGIINLEKIPEVLFIIDTKTENNALTEAMKTTTKVVAILDTNSNPDDVDYPVVANDDSPTSIEYLLNELLGQLKVTKKQKK
ncbi:MAG: 30S ribosomal protein S2 [Patescibacteria group bacterium]